jgi:hypothetical protein
MTIRTRGPVARNANTPAPTTKAATKAVTKAASKAPVVARKARKAPVATPPAVVAAATAATPSAKPSTFWVTLSCGHKSRITQTLFDGGTKVKCGLCSNDKGKTTLRAINRTGATPAKRSLAPIAVTGSNGSNKKVAAAATAVKTRTAKVAVASTPETKAMWWMGQADVDTVEEAGYVNKVCKGLDAAKAWVEDDISPSVKKGYTVTWRKVGASKFNSSYDRVTITNTKGDTVARFDLWIDETADDIADEG